MSFRCGLALALAALLAACASPRSGSPGEADAAADAATSAGAGPTTGPDVVSPGQDSGPIITQPDMGQGTGQADARPTTTPDAAQTATPPLTCPTGQTACASTAGPVCANLQTSSQHCGACGRDCELGPCLFGICQPKAIASGLTGGMFSRGGNSTDGQEIYVADLNARDIKALNVDNGYVREVNPTGGPPSNVALLGPHIYWSQVADGTIRLYRYPKQGPPYVEEMVASMAAPAGTTIAPSSLQLQGGHLYWVRRTDSMAVIERTVPASGSIGQVMTTNADGLGDDMVVHASGIFWADGSFQPRQIWKTPLAGGAATSFQSGTDAIHAIVGADDRHLYWISHVQATGQVNAVVRKPVDGSGAPVSLGNSPFSLGRPPLAVFYKDSLFLFGSDQGGIVAFPLDGSGRATEVAGPGAEYRPVGAAVTDRFAYWISDSGKFWRVVR